MNAPANRLIREKSPYLLQHAHNPVDWYPWGAEAFERARRERKPILLSIGYSTCHWCHVMERESFENERIASIMNRDFVCIKLDREERPDIDRLYMTAVQALTGQGGWPLNVFLTPDLKPFFGGTYFPPDTRWGRPGFSEVLEQIASAWKTQSDKIELSGEQLRKALEQFTRTMGNGAPLEAVSFEKALDEFAAVFDAAWGGFGPAPKFPMPVNLNLLLRLHARGESRALPMAATTLQAMAAGGIYDHVGGGFHRYSTDEQWHVPHFEKMLYDNAQLAMSYLEAFQATGNAAFADVARHTLDYVLRDLRHPDGGFYSAEDADSLPPPGERNGHKQEGSFYLWSKDEILRLAGADAELFCLRYGVRPGGNVMFDPQNEFANKNVLYLDLEVAEAATERGIAPEEARATIERTRQKLFDARTRRSRPDLDDKVLVSWNGLAISALARAAGTLGEPRFLEAAERAAAFLERRLYDRPSRTLLRRWRDGEARGPAVADDYAFLAQGLLDLYEAGFDPRWLDWALELAEEQNRRFFDIGAGGYYMTAEDKDYGLLVRMKESQDNVEPAASSVATLNLLRLSLLLDRADFRETAAKTLNLFADQMADSPRSLPQMLVALDFFRGKPLHLVIAGRRGAPDTEALLARARRRFMPHAVTLLADGGPAQRQLAERLPFLKELRPKAGKATAYVCVDYACRAPVDDPEKLDALLDEVTKR